MHSSLALWLKSATSGMAGARMRTRTLTGHVLTQTGAGEGANLEPPGNHGHQALVVCPL